MTLHDAVLYSVMMLYSFLLIPFAYFFYEEYDIDTNFKGVSPSVTFSSVFPCVSRVKQPDLIGFPSASWGL